MTRQFTAAPAEREPTNLFIGLVGPSSSGKTYTALELAMGIQEAMGGEVAMIDTENKRALQYAELFRKKDGSPGFLHIPFEPPFGSLDYVAAMDYASGKVGRNGTIVIDSASYEHEGEGGLTDYWDQEMRRLAKDDYGTSRAERFNMLAWSKPKAARRKLLQKITRLNCNVIMCFRAKNTSKPAKEEYTRNDGSKGSKNVVVPMGFVPIAGEEFVFEMSLSALFLPGAQGVPTWNPEHPGERMAVKVPAHLAWIKDQKGPISRETGRRLAEWAKGGNATGRQDAKTSTPTTSSQKEEAPAREPENDESDESLTWATKLDLDHSLLKTSKELGEAFNRATKTDEYAALKEKHPDRVKRMREDRTKRIAELKKDESVSA